MLAAAVIRDARLEAGLSQSALASRSGLSQPAIARYESGRVDPSTAQLVRLVRACGREPVVSLVPVADAADDAALLRNLALTPAQLLRQVTNAVRFVQLARTGLRRG